MGRAVVAEERIKNEIINGEQSEKIRVGLLVGQITEVKDLIALNVRTPELQEFDSTEDKSKPKEDVFVDWWVVEHASQVSSLLPGGMGVVGVYICCHSQLLLSFQARLAKILCNIAGQEVRGHQVHQHLILVQYCAVKKKFKCQTINSADPQAGFKPADLKFKDHISQWTKIEAVLSIDTECFIPRSTRSEKKEEEGKPTRVTREEEGKPTLVTREEEGKPTLVTREEEGKPTLVTREEASLSIVEVLDSIETSIVTLRSHISRHGNDPLIKRAKKTTSSSSSMEVIPAVFHIARPLVPPIPPPTLIPIARKVTLKGSMSLLAYVHPKATFDEAVAAIKHDASRSLHARVQAMVEEGNLQGGQDHQLPTRVALTVSPWNNIQLTEYSFPCEDIQECCTRASDLFGPNPNLITALPLERFPACGVIEIARGDVTNGQEAEDKAENGWTGRVMMTYAGIVSIGASISVVLIAVCVWIMIQLI